MKVWKCKLCNFVIRAKRITKVAKILHLESDYVEAQDMADQAFEWGELARKELEKLK